MYYSAPKFENRPAKPMPKSGFDGKRVTAPKHFEKNLSLIHISRPQRQPEL